MKAIIWGSCGSLPSPTSSATIRQKVKEAIWTSRELEFASIEAVDTYLETLPHSAHGSGRAIGTARLVHDCLVGTPPLTESLAPHRSQ